MLSIHRGTHVKPHCSRARGDTLTRSCSVGSNNDILEQPVNLTTLSARYASRAARYITQPRQAPFFIYAAFAHMHVPQAFEPQWRHTSARKTIFGDALREADAAVGVIRAALDGSGKAANTLLLLAADNGPWNVKCSLAGSQGPFLGSWAKDPKNGVPEGKSATGKFTTW